MGGARRSALTANIIEMPVYKAVGGAKHFSMRSLYNVNYATGNFKLQTARPARIILAALCKTE